MSKTPQQKAAETRKANAAAKKEAKTELTTEQLAAQTALIPDMPEDNQPLTTTLPSEPVANSVEEAKEMLAIAGGLPGKSQEKETTGTSYFDTLSDDMKELLSPMAEVTRHFLERPAGQKIIELRIKGVNKESVYMTQPHRSSHTGRPLGVALPEVADRNPHWPSKDTIFRLKNGITFNLENDDELAMWASVQHMRKKVAHSKSEADSSDSAYMYIENPEQEADVKLMKQKVIQKGMNMISEYPSNKYRKLCRMLGQHMDPGTSEEVMQQWLFAEVLSGYEGAKKIIKALKNARFDVLSKVYDAIDNNVIVYNYSGEVFKYGETVLGITEENVVDYLQQPENRDIATSILQGQEAQTSNRKTVDASFLEEASELLK